MQGIPRLIENHPQLVGLLSTIATVGGAIGGYLLKWALGNREHKQVLEELKQANLKLAEQAGKIATQEQLLAQAKQASEAAAALRLQAEASLGSANEKVQQLSSALEVKGEDIASLERSLGRHESATRKMLKLEGQLWEKRPLTGIPKFRPLQERGMPIISVVNLKGGVGKTTITAHLAAALAAKGYRVLMIDLDLQGSLTSLFHSPVAVKQMSDDGQVLQRFLDQSSRSRKVNLLDFVQPTMLDSDCGIVATSDKLAYAEMNLTMSWLLRLGKKDARFLLRRALHQKRVAAKFDFVLLDCPPLINTCCSNALTASDYVLIPVTPSWHAVERVPQLLHTVKRLKTKLNPHLEVAGVVFNRTNTGDRLTSDEESLWNQLLDQGQDQLGVPLHGFKTLIRQNASIHKAGMLFEPPAGNELADTFRRLVKELENRMPRDRRDVAASPDESVPAS